MSSGGAVYPHSDRVHYRIGQKPEKRGWWRKNTGWFGQTIVLLLSIGLLGFGWTARESFVVSMSAQLDSQITPSDSQISIAEPMLMGVRQANNIVNMQAVIADWVRAHPNQKWGITVKSIDGPIFDVSYKPEASFASADVYKLLLLQPLFTQVPTAKQWSTSVSVDNVKRPVARCVDMMLKNSDDACATALGSYLGWDKATDSLTLMGLKRTNLDHQGQPLTTAGDVATYMTSLNGGMLDTKAHKTVFAALQQQPVKKGLAQGCPGCTYIGMSGQNGSTIADAEIVQYSRGNYILVVLSDGGSYEQLGQLSGKVQQRILNEM